MSDKTIISSETLITGSIEGTEDLEIYGLFDGSIKLPGNKVTIKNEGNDKGAVKTHYLISDELVVEGALAKNTDNKQKSADADNPTFADVAQPEHATIYSKAIEVKSTGFIKADIKADKIQVEENAVIIGYVEIKDEEGRHQKLHGAFNSFANDFKKFSQDISSQKA